MAGAALGHLGISPEAFFELTPKEFYYAMEIVAERQSSQARQQFEVARYTAVAIINYTSTILKDRIKDPRRVLPLPWDEKSISKPQTQEELNKSLVAMAKAFGAVHSDRKPGDPPTVLARKFRK